MCTILTVSRKFFTTHEEETLRRINNDAISNDDGWSLITVGRRADEVTVLKSLYLDDILAVIKNNKSWRRFFLHSRMATTRALGLDACHAFSASNGWFVMHNGSLSHKKARRFPVDSELIAALIKDYGPDTTTSFLRENESYANCFLVNPESGKYRIVRLTSGSLYTDGKGNYSSRDFADIKKAVPTKSYYDHSIKLKIAPFRRYTYDYSGTGGGGNNYLSRHYGQNSSTYVPPSAKPASATGSGGSRPATTPPSNNSTVPNMVNNPTKFTTMAKGLHVRQLPDGKTEIKNPNSAPKRESWSTVKTKKKGKAS